jgi:GNAT superfamily N-acetyltransferase
MHVPPDNQGGRETMLNIDVEFVHLRYAYGQHDWIVQASVDGEEVGYVTFAEYEGMPNIQMISVHEGWRRNGIASRMLAELQRRYDGIEIDFGMSTDDGAALIEALPWIVVRNEARDADVEELTRLERTIEAYRRVWDEAANGGAEARDRALEQTKDWNDVSDAADELTRCIEAQPVRRRFIDVDALLAREMVANP